MKRKTAEQQSEELYSEGIINSISQVLPASSDDNCGGSFTVYYSNRGPINVNCSTYTKANKVKKMLQTKIEPIIS